MANINNFMTRFILISILISVVASILLICQSKILCKYKEEHIYLVWILVYIGFYLPFIPPIVSLPKIKMLMDLGIEVEKQKNMPVFFEAVTEMNGENFISFSVILFLIWILGIIIKGIVIIKKRYQFYRYIEMLSMKENELRKLKCFLKIKERMRVKKEVCLIRCSVIGSPFVYYHKRFYVVLPDMAFHDDEMELIFCHEFAHIQRYDIFLNRFQEISGVLFWFNPLLPFIKKEFDIIREVLCDKSVIRILGYTSNIEYAERLLIISNDILRKKEKYIKQYILTSFALKSIEERVTMLLGEKTKNIYCSLLPILMIVFIVSNGIQGNGIQGNGIQGRTDSGKHRLLQEADGDIYTFLEIAGEQRLVIENESESRIQWVIVSALENKKKEKKTSNILADTLDGVVASGNITSGSKGTIDLSGGQYQFYAYCEDGSAIQLKYRLKYIS